jgi:hypothetical protein
MDDHLDEAHHDDTADLATEHFGVVALFRAHRHLLHEPGSRLHEWYLTTPLTAEDAGD